MKHRNKTNESLRDENHPNQEQIAQRAYELYEARGGEPGHEIQDWLEAEQEVNNRRELIQTDG